MIHTIDSLVIDDEKIRATQARLQSLLDQVDAMRDPAQDGPKLLSEWVMLRMKRYANRIAEEFKARKERDRIAVFTTVVADITNYVL